VDDGTDYTKYRTMLKTGLPEGAIRQRMNLDGLNDAQIEAFFGNPAAPAPVAAVRRAPAPAPVVKKSKDDDLFGSDEDDDGEALFGDEEPGANNEDIEEDDKPQTSLKDMLAARFKPPSVKSAPPPPPPSSASYAATSATTEDVDPDEEGDLFSVEKDDPHSLFGGPPVTKKPAAKSKRDSLATLFGDAESSLFGEPAQPPPPGNAATSAPAKPTSKLSSLFDDLGADEGDLFDSVSNTGSRVQDAETAQKSLFGDEPPPPPPRTSPQPPPPGNKRGSVSTMSSADLFGSGGLFDAPADSEDSLFSGGASSKPTSTSSSATITTSASAVAVTSSKSSLGNLFGDEGDTSSLLSEPKRKSSITAGDLSVYL
jgi:hypothetical protein